MNVKEYILRSRNKGITDENIKQNLRNGGWTEELINQAFMQDVDLNTPPPPISNKAPGSATLWDAFEHTLMFISLYFMATGISLITHYLVNYYFPEVPQNGIRDTFYDFIILAAQASVIVSAPLFGFFHLDLTRRTQKNPALRKLKARRVLIYITLVGTFLIMLGNLIATVYTLLSGNITMNFILNLIVTLFIAGTIFAYYLTLVKQDQKAYV